MATVLIVTSAPPLVEGGHLVIARALERAYREAGHRAEIVTTPSNRFGRQASAYVANWMTDVGQTGDGQRVDHVISLRYPSYAVRHPSHVSWLNHTMREYYDLWDQFSSGLSQRGLLKERVRRSLIHAADSYLLRHNVKKLFVQSKTIQQRLTDSHALPSEVLYPPPPQRDYRSESYGDHLLFTSRLTPLKRADLAIRALAELPARSVRLVIGGEGDEAPRLASLARELKVDSRVVFTGRLSESELVDQLARCRAVVFIPKGEDYGFVTVEAFACGRAVITTTDSGGPAELVKAGETGDIVEPTPAALAAAYARMMDSPSRAQTMGERGREWVSTLTWEKTVGRLGTN